MKILAIDTTGVVVSVAVVDEDKIIAEFTLNYKQTHSQTIMPMIKCISKMIDLDLNSIDYIACSNGPGSFTGLRIGAATAKGLSHALDKKIIAIPTLDAMAYNVSQTDKVIVPIIDARRNQVYTAFYNWNNNKIERISDYIAEDINIILENIYQNGFDAVFLGDGVNVHKNRIIEFSNNFTFIDLNNNMQRAASVGMLAIEYAKEGNVIGYNQLNISYFRKSQAEREYEERNMNTND